MADVTFGVKVAPELKEKIDQLFKNSDFETQKEWFQHLLSIYDLHQLKHQDATKRYANDLEYIEQNITRVQETIVQMMKKTADETAHQEAEWLTTLEELRHQLQQSEQLKDKMGARLLEIEEQSNQQTKDLLERHKQNSVLEDLCGTLKKSLADKEAVVEVMRHERTQWESSDYPAIVQRLTEENSILNEQCQKQQHQIDLLRMEYERKLEVEQLKTEYARKETELLLQRKPQKENENTSSRKRGRPRKENLTSSFSMQQQLNVDDYEKINAQLDPDFFDIPEDPEELQEMLGDELPQSQDE
ncbi:hypothetical protein MUG84_16785 [Paenibacillus sp. KQZ6P-2]|uniref:Uncharacterized protein n=1 Tax=Paenibacillus mangrovi TaxID=2931978 RepID=A0A9X1WQ79_9BACL|nr:hypothetical protein [Paenibacillus mangrovi]MCJ8013387.1 hypothetical protein [Paenibacillus mangrovi]